MADKTPTHRTWGGRFEAKPDELMTRINASIGFDKRLWREDIAASKAHAAMLRDQGIIGEADAAAMIEGLDQIAAEYERDGVPERLELEDIHMTVEHRLGEMVGTAAGRLHTARSRNDQVATDFRLWVRNACDEAIDTIRNLQRVLVSRAEEHADTVMPGFTHLQVAQPVTLGHHLMAYYEMLRRDVSRLTDARARMNESPLGSAALAGTGFAIDREIAVRDAVEAVRGRAVEPKRIGGSLTIDGKSGTCQRCGAKWTLVHPYAGIREARHVAAKHLIVGHQVMAESHRLRDLQMGEARHNRFDMLVGALDQHALQCADRIHRLVAGIAHPQAEVGRDLVIARTCSVQPAGRRTDELS